MIIFILLLALLATSLFPPLAAVPVTAEGDGVTYTLTPIGEAVLLENGSFVEAGQTYHYDATLSYGGQVAIAISTLNGAGKKMPHDIYALANRNDTIFCNDEPVATSPSSPTPQNADVIASIADIDTGADELVLAGVLSSASYFRNAPSAFGLAPLLPCARYIKANDCTAVTSYEGYSSHSYPLPNAMLTRETHFITYYNISPNAQMIELSPDTQIGETIQVERVY